MEKPIVKKYSDITYGEWILYYWIDVSTVSGVEESYMRGRHRPLDEAMKLAGGTIEDLKKYLPGNDLKIE